MYLRYRASAVYGDDNRALKLLIVSVVFLFLATSAVVLRFISRKVKRVGLEANDYWIIVALLGAYGNGLSEIVGVALGVKGRHASELTPDQISMAIKCLVAAEATWAIAIWALKLSLLLFYVRIFVHKSLRMAAHGLMVITTLFCIGTLLFSFLNCRPLTASVCVNQHAGWLSTGIINLITDVAILSLPIPSVWHLRLSRVTKMALTVVFGIGFLVCIISILRIISIISISPLDFTYTSFNTDIYSVIEPSLGITSACLPVVRPLWDRCIPARYLRAKLGGGKHKNNDKKIFRTSAVPTGFGHKRSMSHFARLNDGNAFPLEAVEEETTLSGKSLRSDENIVAMPSPTYRAEVKSKTPTGEPDLEHGALPESCINVRTEWDVR